MNSVREIALTFCAAAVVTAGLGLLSGNKLRLSFRYIVALGLICSVLAAVSEKDFNFHYIPAAATIETYSDIPFYEKQAEEIIKQILKEKGVSAQKICAKATKTEEGSIIINNIEILGCNDEQTVIQTLNEKGIDCEIKVIQ